MFDGNSRSHYCQEFEVPRKLVIRYFKVVSVLKPKIQTFKNTFFFSLESKECYFFFDDVYDVIYKLKS